MNDQFAIQDLETLINYTDTVAVSLYIPTHPVTTRIDEDILTLKNALSDIENQLQTTEMRTPDIRAMLQPATDLLESNIRFWQNQSNGLALFFGPNFYRQYRLPVEFTPKQEIAGQFHIKPLLPLFTDNGTFYILAVSQNQVRLLRGTRYFVDELDPETMPSSLADALQLDELEKQHLYQQPTNVPSPGRSGSIFHGYGGAADDDEKERILRFFQRVDKGLRDYLGSSNAPLVFAGVNYLAPIYHQANAYPHLIETPITGNPEQVNAQDLHAAAWELVEPIFTQEQARARERYQAMAGTGLTSVNIAEIVPAAFEGRVDTALVAQDREIRGTFDPDRGGVDLHPQDELAAYDLTDRFAVYTLLRGGAVYVLDPTEMPDGVPAAAVYRY